MESIEVGIIANGVRTDHPIPGLPFVEDAVLPLENRYAIEALGRDRNDQMWGRTDPAVGDSHWKAFTTDPLHTDFAWVVLGHHEYGRTIVLVRDTEAAEIYDRVDETEIATRYGGYLWDGLAWYRPRAAYDWVATTFPRRPVPEAHTITVTEWLNTHTTPMGPPNSPLMLSDLPREHVSLDEATWSNDLRQVWVPARPSDGLPLDSCIVTLEAPELAADELLGAGAVAQRAGIAPSTLRAYKARSENDVPSAQARISGQPMWSEPVVAQWVRDREHSHETLAAMLSTARDLDTSAQPRGIARLWERATQAAMSALRGGSKRDLESRARSAAWFTVASPDVLATVVPVDAMLGTLSRSIRHDIAAGMPQARWKDDILVIIQKPTAQLLDWLIQHYPSKTAMWIQEVAGEVMREHNLTREQMCWAFTSGLHNAMREVDPAVMSFVRTALEDPHHQA